MKNTKNTTVLISGAGIAGPALAYWLGRYGFTPTVVETAGSLREGGQAVDFRGTTQHTVLERMGVLDALHAVRTGGSPMRFINEHGTARLRLPGEFAGGDLEVLRGDLSRVLCEHGDAEYLFDDAITSLTDTDDGVLVTFRRAPPRTVDLVIGADGLHSGVRGLALGPESVYLTHLGYYVAVWNLPNDLGIGDDSLMYNVPGKLAGIGADHRDPTKAGATLMFASPKLDYDRHDLDQQKKLLIDAFTGVGWETPHLLASLEDTTDLYFDSISRVDVDRWSTGRIALVGDAACGATLGGMGTGTAIVAAYVLAGELAAAKGDHPTAFARYEQLVRGFAAKCQQGGDRTGRFLAPRTNLGRRLRDRALSSPTMLNMMLRAGQKIAAEITLPTYPG